VICAERCFHIGCHPQLMHATWLQRPSLAVLLSTAEARLKNAPLAFRRIVVLRPAFCVELATWGCLKISACPVSFLAKM